MAKIKNDQYYTPSQLAEWCVKKVNDIIGESNITEFVEPSAGTGVFLDYLDKPFLAYDIDPKHISVIKADYLSTNLTYQKGRCIIGNPPFGKGNYTSVKFYKKAITQGDYVAFIQPISQLNNNMYMYEFDMVYSKDIGKQKYSGKAVHCCFNIYKRNPNGYNTRPNYDLDSVLLRGVATGASRNDKVPDEYDFSICGYGRIGSIAEKEGQFCQQIYVTVKDPSYKPKIFDLITNTEWEELYGMTATPKLKHWMIYKRIKKVFPELT